MLELISLRQLSFFNVLFGVNQEDTPEARFIVAVKWLLHILQAESMHKKPFNPVIGETHVCWVENPEADWTEFISEQVSHHPPVSSFFVRNKKENVQMEGNLKFSVKFGGNYATITTAGPVTIKTEHDTFLLDKCIPNMHIQNVVWGTKYVMWNGDISLQCPDTGYSVQLTLSEVDPSHNSGAGKIYKDGVEIYEIFGRLGELVEMWPIDSPKQKTALFTKETCRSSAITYPPVSAQVEMDSIRLWKSTSDAIIAADLPTADAEKIKVESSQRARERGRKEAGLPYSAKYFINTETDDQESANWKVKDGITIDDEFINNLKKDVSAERAEKAAQEAAEASSDDDHDQHVGTEGTPQAEPPAEDPNCLLQ